MAGIDNKEINATWKVFRKLVPDLRERYLQNINIKIKELSLAEGETETERFWNVQRFVKKEKKILEDCLDGHSRSTLIDFMLIMYRYGMLKKEDLSKFSKEFQDYFLGIIFALNNRTK